MEPVTISWLSTQIRMLIESSDQLRDVWVIGEVSNWKRASSGHLYFSLKDSGASIAAVMWRNAAVMQNWLPRDGDQIMAHGYVGVYPERGAYQLYVNAIRPAGRGQLYAEFEAVKARLEAAGLFAAERKRPVYVAAHRIGIVTSANAAALRDVLRVLAARWPLVEVILFPTLVQGSDAPAQIVAALANAAHYHREVEPLETLIVARGGGSIEDLWSFNDEAVAHAIADFPVPVVSGVGHETDFTIADFVADLRAPTPSAAAAAVVPDQVEARGQIATVLEWMAERMLGRVEVEGRDLAQARGRMDRLHPQRRIDQRRQSLDDRERRLHPLANRLIVRERERVRAREQRLVALSPQGVLERGYSIVRRDSGAVVSAASQVQMGEQLQVRAAQGEYRVVVSASA